MSRGGDSDQKQWLSDSARLAGIFFGSPGKMKCGEKVIYDEIYNIEYWHEELRRDDLAKQETPQRRRCKWGSSREVKTTLDCWEERRPILSKEEWGVYQKNFHLGGIRMIRIHLYGCGKSERNYLEESGESEKSNFYRD